MRKVSARLLPLLFLLYVVSYLDRTNVGIAALQMNDAIGLSAAAYGLGAGIFFIGYSLFEVPSNIILAHVGARRWIARSRSRGACCRAACCSRAGRCRSMHCAFSSA